MDGDNLPLFRQEALRHKSERVLGQLIVSRPLSCQLLTILITACVLVALVFLIASEYTRRETVPGYLVPTRGVVAIYPVKSGLLLELAVEEGARVEQGTPLFRVRTDQRIDAGKYLSEDILLELQQQKATLDHDRVLGRQAQAAALQKHDSGIARLRQEIDALEALLGNQRRIDELAGTAFARGQQLLTRKMLAPADIESLETRQLEARLQLQNLVLNLQNKHFELDEANLARSAQILAGERETGDIEFRLSEIKRQIAAAAVEQYNSIPAPVAGMVSTVLFSAGQRVDANRPVLSLVPDEAELEAHLYVPARAMGFVQAGQAVSLRYEAYPFQRFGLHKGWIKQVSATVLDKHEVPLLPLNEPVYKVVAALEQQSVTAYGVAMPLRAGSMLTADVELDKRSLFEWLLDPLYSLQGRL